MSFHVDPVDEAILAAAATGSGGQKVAVAEYWDRLQPHLHGFGISRVADITGLDRVGFPVVQAVRPAARSNAVTQGKAGSLKGAAVGAVLECLEMAAGEDLSRLTMAQGDPALWAAYGGGAPWPNDSTPFISAWDLETCRPAAVPRDLVSTDFATGAAAEAAPILRHSIGLGAGSSLGAALMHGLQEAIEADARIRAEASGRMSRLGTEVGDAHYGPLLKQSAEAGLRVAVWQLPCRGGLFAVKASVMEAPGASALPLPATGFAARSDPARAVLAALAEALQARLAVISGAREDITQRMYRLEVPRETLTALWADHAPTPAMPMPNPPDTRPSVQDLAVAVGPVFAVILHWERKVPLAITRIVAPGLVADPMMLEGMV